MWLLVHGCVARVTCDVQGVTIDVLHILHAVRVMCTSVTVVCGVLFVLFRGRSEGAEDTMGQGVKREGNKQE